MLKSLQMMKNDYVQLKISSKDKEELKRLAAEQHLSMSSFLIFLIYNFADNPEWQKTFRLTRVKKKAEG